jgi:hypothetical protein
MTQNVSKALLWNITQAKVLHIILLLKYTLFKNIGVTRSSKNKYWTNRNYENAGKWWR